MEPFKIGGLPDDAAEDGLFAQRSVEAGKLSREEFGGALMVPFVAGAGDDEDEEVGMKSSVDGSDARGKEFGVSAGGELLASRGGMVPVEVDEGRK